MSSQLFIYLSIYLFLPCFIVEGEKHLMVYFGFSDVFETIKLPIDLSCINDIKVQVNIRNCFQLSLIISGSA